MTDLNVLRLNTANGPQYLSGGHLVSSAETVSPVTWVQAKPLDGEAGQ